MIIDQYALKSRQTFLWRSPHQGSQVHFKTIALCSGKFPPSPPHSNVFMLYKSNLLLPVSLFLWMYWSTNESRATLETDIRVKKEKVRYFREKNYFIKTSRVKWIEKTCVFEFVCFFRIIRIFYFILFNFFSLDISRYELMCVLDYEFVVKRSGAPNVNFRKISVRKTLWDLELFSEHLL